MQPRHLIRYLLWVLVLVTPGVPETLHAEHKAYVPADQHSVARIWNEETLNAIRLDTPHPPVHARNLFHLAVVMYNAWSAYDNVAVGYIHHERLVAPDIIAARREAISYAAYRLLRYRYGNSVNAVRTLAALDRRMIFLGYDIKKTSLLGDQPSALGNRIAATIITWGLNDGCGQLSGFRDSALVLKQPVLEALRAGVPLGGGLPKDTNPNLWQPLAFDQALTQNGLVADRVQKFLGATWLKACPFALHRTDAAKPWIDPGPPSQMGGASDAEYKRQALALLSDAAKLGSQQEIDISPASWGNHGLGKDDGRGYESNPITKQAYARNMVPERDFARVLAEFWADGPDSETPPGHWHVLANQVSDSSGFMKRLAGKGDEVDALEWDVKTYFALSAATHDAACAAWALKRYYLGTRPITMIRYMGGKGQSSDPKLPSYSPEGLPLKAGLIEVISAESSAHGQRHYGVGKPGEMAVFSWPGEPANRATQTSPLRWMRAVDWLPYQRKTFNTPAFPGFVSGHSTFSRSAAEVMAAITGSKFFPGGIHSFTAPAQSYLHFERGPSQTVRLEWATYFDASDQAGMSRRFGGIHVPEDDYAGRTIGSKVGLGAWQLAQKYWDGSIVGDLPQPTIRVGKDALPIVSWQALRGMFYQLEKHTADGWATLSPYARATEPAMNWQAEATVDVDATTTLRVLQSLNPNQPLQH